MSWNFQPTTLGFYLLGGIYVVFSMVEKTKANCDLVYVYFRELVGEHDVRLLFFGETSTISEEERLEPGAHEKCRWSERFFAFQVEIWSWTHSVPPKASMMYYLCGDERQKLTSDSCRLYFYMLGMVSGDWHFWEGEIILGTGTKKKETSGPQQIWTTWYFKPILPKDPAMSQERKLTVQSYCGDGIGTIKHTKIREGYGSLGPLWTLRIRYFWVVFWSIDRAGMRFTQLFHG